MSTKTIEVERNREQQIFELFSFLFKRPDLPANDPEGGDNQRVQAQQYQHSGAYDDDKVV
ncbi:gp5 [Shigella phage Buco]|uniref:Uncharacterized protein n=1 Tax=Shigella phage Buco TaxID=2530183 RepID=A0A482JG40_9CAUD|nr:gp5 [Shigella phage Buco]QBP32905.1 hypothetical protein HRP29_gp5 [Shigella phage Buco]